MTSALPSPFLPEALTFEQNFMFLIAGEILLFAW